MVTEISSCPAVGDRDQAQPTERDDDRRSSRSHPCRPPGPRMTAGGQRATGVWTRGFHGRDGRGIGRSWIHDDRRTADRERHLLVPRRVPGGGARRPAAPPRRDPLAHAGTRRRPDAGRAAGDAAGGVPLLGGRVRHAPGRGEAERAAPVHHRIDGVDIHFVHVRSPARGRAAADHDSRLARLGHRAARLCRPADRPHRSRWSRRGRVPPRAAVPPGLRLLRRADRGRLGPRPDRRGPGPS